MDWKELSAEADRLSRRSDKLRAQARALWSRDMKTGANLDKELGRIQTALEILDPESENSLVQHLKSSSDRTLKTIEKLIEDLRTLSDKLEPQAAAPFLKAAAALGELARSHDWKRTDELCLMMRAATGQLEDNIKNIIEES